MGSFILTRLNKLRLLYQHRLLKNALWMFSGQMSKIVIQAVYFIFIARYLGVHGFGAFTGAVALVAIVSPFSGLGSGNILIKYVSRNHKLFAFYWANALIATLSSGILLIGVVMLVSIIILPDSIPIWLVLVIGIADIVAAKIIEISGQAFQAFDLLNYTAMLQIFISLFRLIPAVLLTALSEDPSLLLWGILYMLSSLWLAFVALFMVNREIGKPRMNFREAPIEWKEGFYFSISLSSQNVYNDIDKTMLVKLSSLEVGGTYAAAYRIIDVAFTPVRSLLSALYTKFFESGAKGLRSNLTLLKKTFPVSLAYGLLVAILLYLCAPIIPLILGMEYQNAVLAIQYLSFIPLLKSTHYFAADAMTGAGYQGHRSLVQVIVAVVSVLFNLMFIPMMGWKGAVLVSVSTNFLLGSTIWLVFYYLQKKQK